MSVSTDMAAHQTWDPSKYQKHAAFVAELGGPVIELLAPRPGERILDLGCGDGALTERLCKMKCEVIGVDSSAAQVRAACARGVHARTMAGEMLPFFEEFDGVFSNAALHWMSPPGDVIAGVWRALKAGGRFAGEFGGHGNVATLFNGLRRVLGRRGVDADSVNPWYFPRAESYKALLERQGFQVCCIELIDRPTELPGDITGWLETFCGAFLCAVQKAQKRDLMDQLRAELSPVLCNERGAWVVDYVRLRFLAAKPRV